MLIIKLELPLYALGSFVGKSRNNKIVFKKMPGSGSIMILICTTCGSLLDHFTTFFLTRNTQRLEMKNRRKI